MCRAGVALACAILRTLQVIYALMQQRVAPRVIEVAATERDQTDN